MTIEITHTRRDGTLVEGTDKGDGSAEILRMRDYGWRRSVPFKWSRYLGCWYLPHSRDKQAVRPTIDLLAERLRKKDFEVSITINEDERRSFAEAEADRAERAEGRAERFGGYADNAAASSESLHGQARQMASSIPFGQPILVGHHSEQRDRNFRDRIHNTMGKGIAEGERASYWANREEASANYEKFRKNPPRTLRRIAKLEAELRRVEKWQKGESAGGFTRDIGNPETVAELERRNQELTEEIDYWQQIIKKAEEDGFKVWSRADFKRGDFARAHGRWFEVLRVNPKSVTVPSILNVHSKIVTKENSAFRDMTHTVPYDEVFGRKSAEEMAAALVTAGDS
ncbi:DUF3560 domain-containing protein [Streptomyces regalis]|uniref:DUF3560 domain-containing protein n=1 Tax=Streptomyces regalis TaxID=68262 RepID=A0A124G7L6_9ACTN|nr:DUF3560 domain-containing protein [Streptomyces regalis]KUL23200.1 hypothetical protein ADL12_39665 [Streptomyces regalis]